MKPSNPKQEKVVKAFAVILKDDYIYEVILTEKMAKYVEKNSAEFRLLQASHNAKVIPVEIHYSLPPLPKSQQSNKVR